MKVSIIQADGSLKHCPVCGGTIFRKSRKSKYTNKEKTRGITYITLICNKCGWRDKETEEESIIKWEC